MTGALSAQLDDCWDGDKLEDLYLPYKPKRRTRAAAAREKGLEPLAALLMRQGRQPARAAGRPFRPGRGRRREPSACRSRDIVAEWVAETPGPGNGPRGVCPRGGPLVAGCRRQGGRGR